MATQLPAAALQTKIVLIVILRHIVVIVVLMIYVWQMAAIPSQWVAAVIQVKYPGTL